MKPKTLRQAIARAGGLTTAAQLLDVTTPRLNNWADRGIPLEYAARVERLLGFTRKQQHPDTWRQIWPELAQRVDLARGAEENGHPAGASLAGAD